MYVQTDIRQASIPSGAGCTAGRSKWVLAPPGDERRKVLLDKGRAAEPCRLGTQQAAAVGGILDNWLTLGFRRGFRDGTTATDPVERILPASMQLHVPARPLPGRPPPPPRTPDEEKPKRR